MTAENYPVAPHQQHLYAHLMENRYLRSIGKFSRELVPIRRLEVLARIEAGDASWEQSVPPPLVELIKRDGLFGYKRLPERLS